MIGLPDPRMLLVGGAALILATAGAYVKGRWDGEGIMEAEYARAEAEAVKRVADAERKAEAITQDILSKHAEALQEIVIVRKIIEREVVRYVTPEADALFTVPVGFVWLHDAAASGRVPEAPGTAGSPDAPSGVALSIIAGTVADNYGTCHQTTQQLIDLQSWVRAMLNGYQATGLSESKSDGGEN